MVGWWSVPWDWPNAPSTIGKLVCLPSLWFMVDISVNRVYKPTSNRGGPPCTSHGREINVIIKLQRLECIETVWNLQEQSEIQSEISDKLNLSLKPSSFLLATVSNHRWTDDWRSHWAAQVPGDSITSSPCQGCCLDVHVLPSLGVSQATRH